MTGTGIIAYVKIPKINTTLPIDHGTDDTILQVAVGHIPGTSLPVGSKGIHAVIQVTVVCYRLSSLQTSTVWLMVIPS